jgi:hypothetical protein
MMLRVSTVVPTTVVLMLLLGVVSVLPTVVAQSTTLCRCAAQFEHFYDRRALREQQERHLPFLHGAYNYTGYYVDDNGYYIVEGVRVLPDDDPACIDDNRRSYSSSLFHKIFGNRNLEGESIEEKEDEEPQRALMGMMGMMSSYGYSDDYYSYGKGKVRHRSISHLKGLLGELVSKHFLLFCVFLDFTS